MVCNVVGCALRSPFNFPAPALHISNHALRTYTPITKKYVRFVMLQSNTWSAFVFLHNLIASFKFPPYVYQLPASIYKHKPENWKPCCFTEFSNKTRVPHFLRCRNLIASLTFPLILRIYTPHPSARPAAPPSLPPPPPPSSTHPRPPCYKLDFIRFHQKLIKQLKRFPCNSL